MLTYDTLEREDIHVIPIRNQPNRQTLCKRVFDTIQLGLKHKNCGTEVRRKILRKQSVILLMIEIAFQN